MNERLVMNIRGEILGFEGIDQSPNKLSQHLVPAGAGIALDPVEVEHVGGPILETVEDLGEIVRYTRWRIA